MGIFQILYSFRFLLILLLFKIVSFVLKKIYPIKSLIIRSVITFSIVTIILFAFIKTYITIYPLDVISPAVEINTIDNLNPKIKALTYDVRIHNRTNKDVDVILVFTRVDSDLYPYINLIPKTYTSDKITIKANEGKEFSSTITINSEDTRLINSYYHKIKIKYKQQ